MNATRDVGSSLGVRAAEAVVDAALCIWSTHGIVVGDENRKRLIEAVRKEPLLTEKLFSQSFLNSVH